MNNKFKFVTLAIVSLFFSRFASAEVAPGFNSWDDVKAAADGGQVNVYMWGGSDAINGFVDDFYGVPLKNDYNIALNRMPLAGTVDAVNQVLSEKILKVLSMDESLLQSIGKEGRKNIIQKFNVEKMCFSTYSEYKRIIN